MSIIGYLWYKITHFLPNMSKMLAFFCIIMMILVS